MCREGDGGDSSVEFRKPNLRVRCHLHVEGRVGDNNNPKYQPLCCPSMLDCHMELWPYIKISRINKISTNTQTQDGEWE